VSILNAHPFSIHCEISENSLKNILVRELVKTYDSETVQLAEEKICYINKSREAFIMYQYLKSLGKNSRFGEHLKYIFA
jgi:hypothetical protein